MMSPLREKGISKQGYLTKAPFHGESNGTPGAKVQYEGWRIVINVRLCGMVNLWIAAAICRHACTEV